MTRTSQVILIGLLTVFFAACSPSSGTRSDRNSIRFDLDKQNERTLLSFYLGGALGKAGQDPFEAGVLIQSDGPIYLSDSGRVGLYPELASRLELSGSDGVVSWSEFEPMINTLYYEMRSFPATIEKLRSREGDWHDGTWFSVDVRGAMSPHERNIFIRRTDLLSALADMDTISQSIQYPTGTLFVSEHDSDDVIVEYSVMKKRTDGFWDFFAYDSDGLLTDRIQQKPSDLVIPTKCVGCHFGTKLFEPERSFPSAVADGPNGPRGIYVSYPVGADLVGLFDEHRRRSDRVLGLYGTLFISRLLANPGSVGVEEINILNRFHTPVNRITP